MARTDEELEALEIILSEFFVTKKGKIYNEPLLEQWNETIEKSKKYSKNGKKGGRPAKSLKNNKIKKAIVKPTESHTDTDTDTDISTNVDIAPDKKKRKRATKLPDDWKPKPISQKLKDKLQLTRKEYENEYQKFKDHAAANGRTQVDWQAAWRTWLQSDYGPYGRRIAGESARQASNANASRNGSASSGLGAAFERRYGNEAQQTDANMVNVTGGSTRADKPLQLSFDEDEREDSGDVIR